MRGDWESDGGGGAVWGDGVGGGCVATAAAVDGGDAGDAGGAYAGGFAAGVLLCDERGGVDYNWWDDLPNYLLYAKKILATVTLIEPFSLRRLLTYGGQQTLQGW